MANLSYIFAFGVLLSFFTGLIYLGLPEDLQIIGSTDLTVFGTEIVTVAGTCVIATGIPCATVMIFWGIVNIYTFLIVEFEIIKIFIITPILLGVIYVISELARGK